VKLKSCLSVGPGPFFLALFLVWPGVFLQTRGLWGQTSRPRTVRATVQPRPGAPRQEVEMRIFSVPLDPPMVPAKKAHLADDELVLGVAMGGAAVAFPIRYLGLFEVLNSRVGKTPVAPTW